MSALAGRPLLFGSFDGLHPGHDALLQQAYEVLGIKITVCLALDEDIVRRKGRSPKYRYQEREDRLLKHPLVAAVIPGDVLDGTYSAVISFQPTHIFFGYDQQSLYHHLKKWLAKQQLVAQLITLQPFAAERYKSSIINTQGVESSY